MYYPEKSFPGTWSFSYNVEFLFLWTGLIFLKWEDLFLRFRWKMPGCSMKYHTNRMHLFWDTIYMYRFFIEISYAVIPNQCESPHYWKSGTFKVHLVITQETQRKLVIKSIHDEIHRGVAATQKMIKLWAWWSGYSRDDEEYLKRCKMWRITKFHIDYFTFLAQRRWAMESYAYESCLHYWSGTLINTSWLIFRLA